MMTSGWIWTGNQYPYSEVLKCIVENAYSRIPVYAESRDNIKGSLYKGFASSFGQRRQLSLADIGPSCLLCTLKTKMIDDLCGDFQAGIRSILPSLSMSLRYLGIVTMEDIIEERLWRD